MDNCYKVYNTMYSSSDYKYIKLSGFYSLLLTPYTTEECQENPQHEGHYRLLAGNHRVTVMKKL